MMSGNLNKCIGLVNAYRADPKGSNMATTAASIRQLAFASLHTMERGETRLDNVQAVILYTCIEPVEHDPDNMLSFEVNNPHDAESLSVCAPIVLCDNIVKHNLGDGRFRFIVDP